MATLKTRIRGYLLRLLGYRVPASVDGQWLGEENLARARPVFVLSTGRCGTLWLTELLCHSRQVHVNHSDYPELVRQSGMAYREYALKPEMYQEIVRACRDGYIAQADTLGQAYVETNNRITFLAHAVKSIYPLARFVHLVRHPGDFVRSGLRRAWYEGAAHDEGRIVPRDDAEAWQSMTSIEKIAWLWNETNQFIEGFLSQQREEDYLVIRAEDMFSDPAVARRIIDFIGIDDIPDAAITKMLSRRVNVQRGSSQTKEYVNWSPAEKSQLQRFATLAARYGYEL